MTIHITDQRSEPTCNRNFRAELKDAQGYLCGLGYGMTEAEAIGNAWQDCIDSIESELRMAIRQYEQAVAL